MNHHGPVTNRVHDFMIRHELQNYHNFNATFRTNYECFVNNEEEEDDIE